MATLQKFKLLATQCSVAAAAAPSPTRSPVIHLRRRKTLRMLLTRRHPHSSSDYSPDIEDRHGNLSPPEKPTRVRTRRKLKDLFVTSSPPPPINDNRNEEKRGMLLSSSADSGVGGLARTRRGGGWSRPLTASFRCRLLKRAWRPVLVSIPE